MEKQRFYALQEIIKSNKYDIDLENGIVYRNGNRIGYETVKGYRELGLYYNKTHYKFKEHQIIATAAGLDLINKEVNHIDGDKLNNRINNLEAVTGSENMIHAYKTGLRTRTSGANNRKSFGAGRPQIFTNEQILKIIEERKQGKKLWELAWKYGVSVPTISKYLKNN